MNVSAINDLIDELEQSDVSLSNVRNLSALYIVKNHLVGNVKFDEVSAELNDILPSYIKYIEIKRKYQLHETTEDVLYINMKELCREIKEFIRALYSGTDTPKEREMIKQMIKEVQ